MDNIIQLKDITFITMMGDKQFEVTYENGELEVHNGTITAIALMSNYTIEITYDNK